MLDLEKDEQQKTIHSISDITRQIRRSLETQYGSVWIEGEISNLVHHSSGHMYLSLKDEGAQISAVIFRNVNAKIPFEMKDGLQVVVFGKVTVYEKRGNYQIVVERVEPKGVGALELALRQLIEKLKNEGLFEEEYKKEIPFLPERIGVITSPTGAVIRDIINVSQRRFPGIPILLYPVKVQGDGAREEIVEAIESMNKHKLCDVLIVGRGGGSLEDLWAFNEEVVARAIFNSEIPIISAVGHEVDVTISDFVADKRAATPSQAAEIAVPSRDELLGQLRENKERMLLAVKNLLEDLKERITNAKESYALTQPERLVEQARQRLDELLRQMSNYLLGVVSDKRIQLSRIQMTPLLSNVLLQKKAGFSKLLAQLDALSPLGILSRGYSVTVDEKMKPVREAGQLKVGEMIRTQLGKGVVESEVKRVEKVKRLL